MENLVKLHAAWCKSLQQAVETDAWGQVVEAVEAYERLAGRITQALPACSHLTAPQKGAVENVVAALELRAACLNSVDGKRSKPTKEDMEDVLDALRGALADEPEVFPIDVRRRSRKAKKTRAGDRVLELDGESGMDERTAAELVSATTQVTVPRPAGATYLDFHIARIGLKDASTYGYVNPTIAVSVLDYSGKSMEEVRETGVGVSNEPQHVSFNTGIQLATSFQKMQDHGAAITFEFFHYKAKKRKKSCRCWALLEMDEIKDGPIVLELYQKPMDPKRKRIHLFTEKELYLQVELQLQVL